MYERHDGKFLHYACEVGHAFSPENLTTAHTDALERAIWIAIRTLRERTAIQRSLARNASESDTPMARHYEETAAAAERDSALLQEILERL